jgi:hypothetical protein
MNEVKGSFPLVLVATLAMACGGTGLGTEGPGTGGQSGHSSATGGAGAGGVPATGGGWGSGGVIQGSGGNAVGGSIALGGSTGAGGVLGAGGATVVGGRGGSGAGGTTTCATLVACPAIGCLYGEIPNPDPCGCPICAGPDAGVVKDASADTVCIIPPCLPISACGPGEVMVTPECGCPTCVSVDGGSPDGLVCPPISCPAIACAGGMVPNPDDPCACPICAPVDAGTKADGAKLACVDLDECACGAANGCSIISEACYCPFPQCGSGACICGGGRFIGCAPVELSTCGNAKARVGALCPNIKSTVFDNLCSQTNSACITKCLNEVTSCSDVSCAFCDYCDCATDRFLTCVGKCTSGASTK